MSDQFGIEKILKDLGVAEFNSGVSTGSKWLEGKGELLESYSPVDGHLIGSVRTASNEEYSNVVDTGLLGLLFMKVFMKKQRNGW